MFIILLIAVLTIIGIVIGGISLYIFKKSRKTLSCKVSVFISLLPAVIFIVFSLFFGIITSIIILLHFFAFLLTAELLLFIFKKLPKKQLSFIVSVCTASVFTTAFMLYGWSCAHNIHETSYTLKTEKQLPDNNIRIVQIADSHLGITLDGKKFTEQIERIQKLKPDIVVITGDFVDDNSNKNDMIQACKALSSIKAEYGVYFTFGNHDKGYFENSHDFTENELRNELLKNNVKILEDEAVLIGNSFYIVGRQDKSEKDRKNIMEIMSVLDNEKYSVILDHQPNDYENELEAEVDLVLSGHTHGGHIFPAGLIGLITGANDKVYGHEKINNTDFIVTSGISGWEIPFKTGTISEFVVIDIHTN